MNKKEMVLEVRNHGAYVVSGLHSWPDLPDPVQRCLHFGIPGGIVKIIGRIHQPIWLHLVGIAFFIPVSYPG